LQALPHQSTTDLRGYRDVRQGSEALDLKQALGVLRRRLPVILLCAVVVAGAAFAYSKHEAKKYRTTASVVFNNNQLSQEISGATTSGSFNSRLAQQATDLELLQTGDMAARTASLLGGGLTEQQVHEGVSVAGKGESGIVDVSVTAASPELAAKIANTYVRLFVEEQASAERQSYKSILVLVRKQLAALSPKQRTGTDGLNLQERAQTLSILSELKQGSVEVAGEAVAPARPFSPKTSTNTAIGGVLGLFIGFALAFILESLDRRIRLPEDLEAIYDLPLLGSVPRSKALARERTGLPLAEAEAFGLVRAHLRFFNINRELHSVAIVSAEAGDGKTTIARRVAEAAARSSSRVLLLEMDLRHPTLAERLGLPAGPGIVDVLIGASRMNEAIRSIAVETTQTRGGSAERTLDVLVAGAAMPTNPGGLLESQAMEAVLTHARSAYDLVVIDTPSLTSVSDAFSLLTKVDGAVIVGRIAHSQRETAERLSEALSQSQIVLLGVIANDLKSRGLGRSRRDRVSNPSPVVSVNGSSSSASSVSSESLEPAGRQEV
jgi:succinoglycan biosynthesis transport protein ExoP